MDLVSLPSLDVARTYVITLSRSGRFVYCVQIPSEVSRLPVTMLARHCAVTIAML